MMIKYLPGFRMLKKSSLFHKARTDSGIILLVVLWSLVILGILAVSLGRGTRIDLALTRHAVARVRAKALAWAGMMASIDQLRQDTSNDDSKNFDTLYQCGVALDEATDARDIFGPLVLGDGEFEVSYTVPVNDGEDAVVMPGFQDEERRVNLNTLNPQNVQVLIHLIELLGFDATVSSEAAYSLLDWQDGDDVLSHAEYGAENEYYKDRSDSYAVKNQPLESLSEILLVRGFTVEMLEALRPWVTLYPDRGSFLINFDTASELVLRAVFRSRTGQMTNTSFTDADAIAGKMIDYRNGSDGIAGTVDDQVVELSGMNLNADEQVLYLSTQNIRKRASDYFRIRSIGRIPSRNASVVLEAVVRREDLSMLSWDRE